MKISYDEVKRIKTLLERDVDFDDAIRIFANETITMPDLRFNYGEERFVSVGYLSEVMMIVVWTQRAEFRRIISMRKANARERLGYSNLFTAHKN